jgi:small subunit ribosomal protein S7
MLNKQNRRSESKSLLLKFARILTNSKIKGEIIVLEMLRYIKKKVRNPLFVFNIVLSRLYPSLKTIPRKLGGRSISLPYRVTKCGREYLAIKFLIRAANSIVTSKVSLAEKLANEMISIFRGRDSDSIAIGYKKELIKTIIDNRPFVRFRKSKYKSSILSRKNKRQQLFRKRYRYKMGAYKKFKK